MISAAINRSNCAVFPCKPIQRTTVRVACAPQSNSCNFQSSNDVVKRSFIFTTVSTSTLVQELPSLAIVDERMNGDGVGFALGFNEPVLFWSVLIVFALIWGLYFVSQSELGGDEDEDAGLSL